jgi:hypothetical protein
MSQELKNKITEQIEDILTKKEIFDYSIRFCDNKRKLILKVNGDADKCVGISFEKYTDSQILADYPKWLKCMDCKITKGIVGCNCIYIVTLCDKACMKDLNFNWFNSWDGYSKVRWNRYSENKKMALHIDHIKSLFDGDRKGIPILSILGMLNNDYEGGKFIMFDNYEIELKAGDLLLFPSVFLYPHKVTPVTKGERYSFISWSW